MPNWADNLLTIEGPEAEVKRFIEHVTTKETYKDEQSGEEKVCTRYLDLNKLNPMPPQLDIGNVPAYPDKSIEELEALMDSPDTDDRGKGLISTLIQMIKNREELGYDSWYSWCVDNWGTKWNINDGGEWEILTPEKAQLRYSSAWSPPNAALQEGSKLFPELKICNAAMDCGMNWICETHFEDGVMSDECSELEACLDLAFELFGYEPYVEDDDDESLEVHSD